MLDWVQGYKIPFTNTPPSYESEPQHWHRNEKDIIASEIKKLLLLGAISECLPHQDQFTSPIFLVPKPNGTFRFILNLKKLNQYIQTEHFKLEDIRTACKLMSKDCYMASIDLKEAYFSVPIAEQSKKYLRFKFGKFLYQFNALPYGLCTAPYVFTKLLKPVSTFLRNQDIILTNYLDDSLYFNDSKNGCKGDIDTACKLLQDLGFIINKEKSIFSPSQTCRYLGFILNSTDLSLSVPHDKQINILEKINTFKQKTYCKIREFAQLIGMLNSNCPAIPYGWLYTKVLERQKYLALLKSDDNYEKNMSICQEIKTELVWWQNNIQRSNPIKQYDFQLEIHTDASTTGWGAVCNLKKASGSWSRSEQNYHINYLELKAALLGLQCYTKEIYNCEILLRIDNTTAIAYINKMGGIQFPHLNDITKEIWQWCENRNIWVYASYINTKDNFEADRESRKVNIEWELSHKAFLKITECFGAPDIDLFASRINNKCKKFVSWRRDPEAFKVDAFTINWKSWYFYAFPPFSLLLKCLHKIKKDRATGVLIFPLWPSQPWFPLIKSLLVGDLIIFEPDINLLLSPFREHHPLYKQLTLAAGLLSGKHSQEEEHQTRHST